MMRKAIYKGGCLPFHVGIQYDVRIIWDDDCDYGYVYVYNLGGTMKCVYDGRTEMEKEWEFVKG